MTLRPLTFMLCLFLAACGSNDSSTVPAPTDSTRTKDGTATGTQLQADTLQAPAKANVQPLPLKQRLLGAWGNETSGKALFVIRPASVYYADHHASYKYSLAGNTITIFYAEFTYKGEVSLVGDTLVIDASQYGRSKYWRFNK